MPPAHARGTYASPSYASPPPPVLVTEADLPRVIAVVVFGTLAASWLALQLDAYYAADDQHADFYFPYERAATLQSLGVAPPCHVCATMESVTSGRMCVVMLIWLCCRKVGYFLIAYKALMVISRYLGHGACVLS